MYDRKIELTANLYFRAGEKARLSLTHNGKEYIRESKVVETPIKAPLSLERIEEALKKSGESPFIIREIITEEFSEGFLPVKELNEMRRLLLEDIVGFEVQKMKRTPSGDKEIPFKGVTHEIRKGLKLVGVATKDQLQAALDLGAENLVLYPFYRGEKYIGFKEIRTLLETRKELNLYIKVSSILRTELHPIIERIRKLKAYGKISGIITGNAGVIRLLAGEFYIIGDYKLNLFNSDAIKFYDEEVPMSMISEELNRAELKELKHKDRYISLVYGRQELMHSEYCPVGAAVGGMTRETPCNEACMTQNYRLKDRIGEEFPVMTDIFCRSYIMNGKPKNLLDSTKDLESIGISAMRIDLTTESFEEARTIIQAFLSGEALTLDSFNRGHYRRGVE